MKTSVIIATHGSDLGLWQASHVKGLLAAIGLQAELKNIKTPGEKALLDNEADIAIHSYTDLPAELHSDLIIAAVTEREDPSELLIIRKECVDAKQKFFLKKNAVVGNSSASRKSQMLAFRKDIELIDLQGNIPDWLKAIRDGKYDAILLASSDIDCLELALDDLHVEKLDPHEFIPAPAQGVMAIQIRKTDTELFEALQRINKKHVQQQIAIERKILTLFEGSNKVIVNAYAEYDDDKEIWKVIATKSDTLDKMPVSVYLESKNQDTLAERAVEKIRNIKPSSVFITRNLKQGDYFTTVLTANGFEVNGHSLIEFAKIPLKHFSHTDWIFFSSKHAVKYFFTQQPEIQNQKIGCIGKSTADEIRKHGKRAEFIGTSADTKLTGKQFASRVGSGTVLFPMAKGSQRSVQNGFVKEGQVIDLPVYETIEHNEEPIPYADILVFTSPANVQAYLKKNHIDKKQKLVAFGEAAGSTLRKAGFTYYVLSDRFDDTALARAVFTASSLKN